jgi:glycerol-3-phosphate dehydrogenase (NAD+)
VAGDCDDGGRITTNKKRRQKVVVLGAGAFGTAMAYASAQGTDNDTVLYMRDADQCRVINSEKRNPKYLSDFSLQLGTTAAGGGGCGDGEIRAICTLEELRFELSTPGVIILHALPCQLTPPWFGEHRDIIPEDALICITAKGLYLRTNQLMGHAILDALDRAEQPLAFLSGPSFAVEIMKGHPTTLVVASDVPYNAVRVQKMLSNFKTIRVFVSDDPIGVQLGGALKNPLAVGAGMVSAMGYGTNTLSAAVTRAADELRQLCVAMGANPRTIDGLAGMGDLMLTCFSAQSRNQRAGARLMTGETVEEIQKEMTVEGM